MTKNEVLVKGINVNYKQIDKQDYISLTDIAKYYNDKDPSGVIRNWMSNKDSFDFYSLWEVLNNPNFNSVEMRRIKNDEVGYNRFTMTPKRWKDDFNAIGIISSAGKYSSGTYAHMESFNAILIKQNVSQGDRLVQLNNMAKSQLRVLQNSNNRLLLENKK